MMMIRKMKVRSGPLRGLVGRVICIDDSWPAPYAIQYGVNKVWFYPWQLGPAGEGEQITQGSLPMNEATLELIRNLRAIADTNPKGRSVAPFFSRQSGALASGGKK